MRELSDDKTRLITDDAAFALVGFIGGVEPDESSHTGQSWKGRHAGCFGTAESARAWLRGEGEPDFKMSYSV